MHRPFPQYLAAPIQVLWFEPDDMGIMIAAFTFALIYGGWYMWMMVIVGPWYYGRLKKRFPRGFFRHVLYFAGLIKLEGYPSYFEDTFIE
ncbi:MAG: type IV conjugative transfer system protein TraL [Syntrophales bacterium]